MECGTSMMELKPQPGQTSVTFSDDLVSALGTLNVQVAGYGSTEIDEGIANFLITGGSADLDTTKVEIAHAGGLTFTAGDITVDLTDFVISNLGDQAVLTGLVIVNGELIARVPLFGLQVGEVTATSEAERTNLDLTDVAITLTSEAAAALNQIFGVTAFTQDLSIGTAQVDAFVNSLTGDVEEIGSAMAPTELKVESHPDTTLSVIPDSTLDVIPEGETSVTFSDDLVNALGALNLEATGFGSTVITDGIADFLITGGAAELDRTKVEIVHGGGLTFSSADTTVNLTDFVISTLDEGAVLTGLVTVNGDLLNRVDLFDLKVGTVAASPDKDQVDLDLEDVTLSLTSDAATALNQVFGVTNFTTGFNVGSAQVDALLG